MDSRGIILISGFLTLLTFATFIVEFLRRRPKSVDSATLASCRSRINAWWLLFTSFLESFLSGLYASMSQLRRQDWQIIKC